MSGGRKFTGDTEVLDEFMKLVDTRIRHPDRTAALQAWRDFKQRRLAQLCVERAQGAPLRKGWNMRALSEHLIDLSGVTLDGVCLGYVDLRGVDLSNASLRGVGLKGAQMESCCLRGADLSPLEGDPPQTWASSAPLYNSRLLEADMSHADLRDADLREADLSGARLVGAKLEGTTLTRARVYGVSAWDVSLCDDGTKRQGLVITRDVPDVSVDDLEVAQFVYLLLNRGKLRNVIDAVTSRGVLLLGPFRDGGLQRLERIAEAARQADYLPMIFDFDKPDDRDFTETVQTLAGLARFVVADLSGPSVPHELMAVVPHLSVPMVAVVPSGHRPHAMFGDLLKYDWVHDTVIAYEDAASFDGRFAELLAAPAEAILTRRPRTLRFASI